MQFCTFQGFLCLSTTDCFEFERFTPDPEESSRAIGTESSELLCRFDTWSSRASSAPVSRSRFVVATGHIVSGTVARRTRSPHSAECQPFVIPHKLTRLATRCSPIAFRHQRKSTSQLSQVRLRIIQRTHTPLTMMTLHSVWKAKQSPHLSQQSVRETKLAEIVVVCRHRQVDRPRYD